MQEAKTPVNLFKEAQNKLGISLKELAEYLNTSHFAVTKWLNGDVEPTRDVLERLAILLQSDIDFDRKNTNEIFFASTGSPFIEDNGSATNLISLKKLSYPRNSILDDLLRDGLWAHGEYSLTTILENSDVVTPTRSEALDEVISAGKNTYTYDAHTYHTKVPPQGIANVISKYLPEGGVILDPFAGSGMTGVAASHLGYDVILNELSPAASFIAYNFLNKVDAREFSQAVNYLLEKTDGIREKLYTTSCRECGKKTEIIYTVWSYKLECNNCNEIFTLWDHGKKYGKTIKEHKFLRVFPCPGCGLELNKSYLKRHEIVPVFLGYKCCSRKIIEHPLLQKDYELIDSCMKMVSEYKEFIPNNAIPNGDNLSQPKRHGLDTIGKLYTDRNLIACAALWKEILSVENIDIASSLAFVFTSLYRRVTKLAEYRFWGGSGNTATLNVPHISNESNVFITFKRKAKSIADHYATTSVTYSGNTVIRTGSATNLNFLPDNSIDFIFTDPPFGGNINYSEMNILWESWLNKFTETTNEAIMNKSQGKTLESYEALMRLSLKEAYRVLKKDHWMVLVFMNSSEKIWKSLKSAIVDAGFSIKNINIFDKQHGTFKQFVSENTAGSDLMIHCQKLEIKSNDEDFKENKILSVDDFLKDQLNQIPYISYLHVSRKKEIDYRTLYSRYISIAMKSNSAIINFSSFRKEALNILEGFK